MVKPRNGRERVVRRRAVREAGVRMHIVVPRAQLVVLRRLAAAQERTVSNFVRHVLSAEIARQGDAA